MDRELGSPRNTTYHIVLGGLWRAGGFKAELKASFVEALTAIFQPITMDPAGFTKAQWHAPNLTGYE